MIKIRETPTAQNMRECELPLSSILLPKHRTYDSVFIRNNKGQRKPLFWLILRCDHSKSFIYRKFWDLLAQKTPEQNFFQEIREKSYNFCRQF